MPSKTIATATSQSAVPNRENVGWIEIDPPEQMWTDSWLGFD